jgi:hypothetical protein
MKNNQFLISENIEDLYCFRYNIGSCEMPKEFGWSFFNIQADFERMNVPPESWTMTTLNKEYDVRHHKFHISFNFIN